MVASAIEKKNKREWVCKNRKLGTCVRQPSIISVLFHLLLRFYEKECN